MLELKKQDIERLEKYPMRCQEGLMEEAEVVMTIFNPYGAGAWHILEAQKLEGGGIGISLDM